MSLAHLTAEEGCVVLHLLMNLNKVDSFVKPSDSHLIIALVALPAVLRLEGPLTAATK